MKIAQIPNTTVATTPMTVAQNDQSCPASGSHHRGVQPAKLPATEMGPSAATETDRAYLISEPAIALAQSALPALLNLTKNAS